MSHPIVRALALTVVLLGCRPSQDVAAPETTRAQELRSEAESAPAPLLARETALLSLVLSSDGKARFEAARRRPIAFLATAARPGAPGEGWVLEVRHPQLAQPLRVPVSLGQPGAPSAPAMHAWQAGGTLLRAPCFGAGTRYELIEVGEHGETRAAQVEVVE